MMIRIAETMSGCPTERIVKAAEQRFADYGPGKTTMAEIADDCGMSVGNLYRYFKNKEAIAVACLERQLQARLQAGMAAAAAENTALKALHTCLLVRLRMAHQHFHGTRHLLDLMICVESGHRDVLLRYEQQVIEALSHILQRGVADGEFAAMDCRQTAYDIHQATLRYNHPLSLKNHTLDVLEGDLKRLIQLLYRGLRCG